MPINRDDYVYPDPRSPGHVREVFRRIQDKSSDLSDELEELTVRVSNIEGQVRTFSRLFDSNGSPGQAVYLKSDAHADLADADALATAVVAGLVFSAVTAGQQGQIISLGRFSQDDWTTVTGSSTLIPGAKYFLSTTLGGLTATAPTGAGDVVVEVGLGVSPTTIDINIKIGVLL